MTSKLTICLPSGHQRRSCCTGVDPGTGLLENSIFHCLTLISIVCMYSMVAIKSNKAQILLSIIFYPRRYWNRWMSTWMSLQWQQVGFMTSWSIPANPLHHLVYCGWTICQTPGVRGNYHSNQFKKEEERDTHLPYDQDSQRLQEGDKALKLRRFMNVEINFILAALACIVSSQLQGPRVNPKIGLLYVSIRISSGFPGFLEHPRNMPEVVQQ